MEKKEEMANEESTKDILDEGEEIEEPIEEQDKMSDEISIELEKKEKEIKELSDRLLRLQADFINYKNRVKKEKENIYSYATEDLMIQILPILDNFERALENKESHNGFYQGVEMIYNQLIEILKSNGLKEIECLGECFDPNFHHAVFMEKVEDTEEGTILEILQKGYMLKDKVIRPSMVKVAE
ncbi:MAG: nucleotide exchange factor GrpE [Tissierellia bacterium]|nr:nucleotide exchange factor GrpE [Tissierellia bacterium]